MKVKKTYEFGGMVFKTFGKKTYGVEKNALGTFDKNTPIEFVCEPPSSIFFPRRVPLLVRGFVRNNFKCGAV